MTFYLYSSLRLNALVVAQVKTISIQGPKKRQAKDPQSESGQAATTLQQEEL